jgi:hypothetical protein
MSATATKKIAFATLAAPALAALAVGLAGTAHAETPSMDSAEQTVHQLEDEGANVVIDKNGDGPIDRCSVIAVRQDRHRHHGGPETDEFNAKHVDMYCQANG